MLKIRRPLGRLIFNMGIAIPDKTVFLIETAPWLQWIGQKQPQKTRQEAFKFWDLVQLIWEVWRYGTTSWSYNPRWNQPQNQRLRGWEKLLQLVLEIPKITNTTYHSIVHYCDYYGWCLHVKSTSCHCHSFNNSIYRHESFWQRSVIWIELQSFH